MLKLLVVIDYQKDFVDGALGFEKQQLGRAYTRRLPNT